MTDPKDGESFFRKMVRFVANPATDWADLSTRQDDSRELERSELKAMVERKRRNDFVRKREFDLLRKVRREGLSPEQLAALGNSSSRLDDSETRPSEGASAMPEGGVKAKIDEIEQQMVGDHYGSAPSRRPPLFFDARTEPAMLQPRMAPPAARQDAEDSGPLPALPPLPDPDAPAYRPAALPAAGLPPLSSPSPTPAAALPPLALSPFASPESTDFSHPFAVEVSEVVHDPDLDEPVIAFANADFTQCEQSLSQLIGAGGVRAQHAETWLVLFDLYRATGQQPRFESLALDYANQFGWSAPQWFSLPKMVADAQAEDRPASARVNSDVGWTCPPRLDVDAVARLRAQTLQMPLPWVFDWSQLALVEAEAATQLASLMRIWAGQKVAMHWLAGERLFEVLKESAPTGMRDADPAFWLARLEALRLANRPDQFDEAAIDYCVTYEVSPPSWERARCTLRIRGSGASTRSPALSLISEVSTTFQESSLADEGGAAAQIATVELSGQLVGDISQTLERLNMQLGHAPVVNVNCARLIRVDFIAAGDLLNWVLAKRGENRIVQFIDAHRLVALFFGAMGINEHAKVQVRKV